MDGTVDSQILPSHIEDTIRSIAKLHSDQAREGTAFQRAIARLTAALGRPKSLVAVTLVLGLWVSASLSLTALRLPSFDPPPFTWLQGCVSAFALYVTMLILSTQQRDDVVAGHREQLTLELAILSEQKTAKIIHLLEELRRDNPQITNRIDPEATAMSVPADPQAVFDAIKGTLGEVVEETM